MKKKLLIVLVVILMAMSTMGCTGQDLPINFSTWGKITKNNEFLEKSCSGFTEWTGIAQKLEQEYRYDLVSGNETVNITAIVRPIVEVDKYTVIMRSDSLESKVNTDKFIVTVGYNLITGEERAQAIKLAVEKLDGITGVVFIMNARSNFLDFGQYAVNEGSISCTPQILE